MSPLEKLDLLVILSASVVFSPANDTVGGHRLVVWLGGFHGFKARAAIFENDDIAIAIGEALTWVESAEGDPT